MRGYDDRMMAKLHAPTRSSPSPPSPPSHNPSVCARRTNSVYMRKHALRVVDDGAPILSLHCGNDRGCGNSIHRRRLLLPDAAAPPVGCLRAPLLPPPALTLHLSDTTRLHPCLKVHVPCRDCVQLPRRACILSLCAHAPRRHCNHFPHLPCAYSRVQRVRHNIILVSHPWLCAYILLVWVASFSICCAVSACVFTFVA